MNRDIQIEIAPYADGHQRGVIDLIVGIQRSEYGLLISAADQPDLADIPGFYCQGAGNFWVALAANNVVGTVALREFAPGQGALRKMFVAQAFRGRAGVAARLLQTLLEWARDRSVETITLGTTDRFLAAHRFYAKHGFTPVSVDALPEAFPRMSVDTLFFKKVLSPLRVVRQDADAVEARVDDYVRLLQVCVDDGASIGFLPPLSEREARDFWARVVSMLRAGEAWLWSADVDGKLVGTVQLHAASSANGRHRGEVAKLMVDPDARRRGIARALMLALEAQALSQGRTTLVLDTRAGDPSERLYASLGYQRVGEIPRYARSASGQLDSTAFFYKLLEP